LPVVSFLLHPARSPATITAKTRAFMPPLYKGVRMTKPSDQCPKHGTNYRLRRNVKTGEVAIACPLCDVEERGGDDEDRKLVADKIQPRDGPPQDEKKQ